MYLAWRQGQSTKTQRWASDIAPLTVALFRKTDPAPVKYALHPLGLMSARVRLPLVEPAEPTRSEINAVLADICEIFADYVVGWPASPPDKADAMAAGRGDR